METTIYKLQCSGVVHASVSLLKGSRLWSAPSRGSPALFGLGSIGTRICPCCCCWYHLKQNCNVGETQLECVLLFLLVFGGCYCVRACFAGNPSKNEQPDIPSSLTHQRRGFHLETKPCSAVVSESSPSAGEPRSQYMEPWVPFTGQVLYIPEPTPYMARKRLE